MKIRYKDLGMKSTYFLSNTDYLSALELYKTGGFNNFELEEVEDIDSMLVVSYSSVDIKDKKLVFTSDVTYKFE
jgi:hypothetical protein